MENVSRTANFIVLREQGKTYQEIADMYGLSKQRVEQCIKRFESLCNTRIRKNNCDIEKIAYKGIYKLFKDDNTMTVSRLTRMLFGYQCGSGMDRINKLIKGENARMSIEEMKKIVEITGMPFEELFEPRDC